jgi:formyltetrahydrofolate-dependent phosphoribosylglycinamide formyltransferase
LPDELKIAVFASGKGSNFKAILEAIRSGAIPNASVALVISNNADAGALELARQSGITALHINARQFASADEFTIALLAVMREAGVNFVVLAGYMKKIDPRVIQTFRNRIINIHPALLPAFGGPGMYGMFVHEAVIASRAEVSGATVHIVDEEYDRGPILLQRSVPVDPADTPESLAAKVLLIEHALYPEAVRLFAEGRVSVDGGHVTIMNS